MRLLREIGSFAREVVGEFVEDDCTSAAASLAYYTVFSIAPLLVIVIVLVGVLVTPEEASALVDAELHDLLGPQGAHQIGVMIAHVQSDPEGGLIARTVGAVAALIGATGVMVQLQATLNRAFDVMPDPDHGGVWPFFTKRLLSFAMILAIAFVLLVSLILGTVLSAVVDRSTDLLPFASALVPRIAELGTSFTVTTLLFMAIFKVMPEARIRWRDVALGAAATALLFTIGKSLIAMYLGRTAVGTAYGSASSLAIVLVWVYFSALIVLLGAEFTQVWTRRYGGGVRPVRGAVLASAHLEKTVIDRAVAEGRVARLPASADPARRSR